MSRCTFGVVVFPGSNCDRDVVTITQGLLQCPTRMIAHTETTLEDIDVVVLPGGFSYGDYLRCGAIAQFAPIMQAVQDHADQGKQVLGICNGFQILVETGLLPGALIQNRQLQFICETVPLRVERTDLPWTYRYSPGQQVTFPVAHGEGCYICEPETLAQLQQHNQIVFRYESDTVNGSMDRIAGICNRSGNVLGLMPHPERASDPNVHRIRSAASDPISKNDGLLFWQSIVELAVS